MEALRWCKKKLTEVAAIASDLSQNVRNPPVTEPPDASQCQQVNDPRICWRVRHFVNHRRFLACAHRLMWYLRARGPCRQQYGHVNNPGQVQWQGYPASQGASTPCIAFTHPDNRALAPVDFTFRYPWFLLLAWCRQCACYSGTGKGRRAACTTFSWKTSLSALDQDHICHGQREFYGHGSAIERGG